MAYGDVRGWTSDGRYRLSAAVAAGLVQFLVLAALISGLAARALEKERDTLSAVQFVPQPSQPSPTPEPRHAPKPSQPEGRKGSALPREAPSPAIPLALPAAAPTAQAGSAAQTAPGTSGSGTGSGAEGSGAGGGGGGGLPARRIGGALTDRDYPDAAARIRAAGVVAIRFRILTNGRVADCRIVRSSGYAVLDDVTCQLVERRFRYAPARDAAGQPIEDSAGTSFTWGPRD